jgi:hypothetical protein
MEGVTSPVLKKKFVSNGIFKMSSSKKYTYCTSKTDFYFAHEYKNISNSSVQIKL